MKLIDQNIPAELLDAYKRSLRQSTDWHPGSNIYTIRTRQPFRLPHMQSDSLSTPSLAQLAVRSTFKKCINCFNNSPKTGGAVPPAGGYRSKEWWYNAAVGSGLWYYDYFIQQTWQTFFDGEMPDWCAALVPCHSTTQGYWKHTGQKYGDTWGAAWSSAYNKYTGMSWTECEYYWNNLNCYANAGRPGTNNYWALISCTKNTLVFKPEEHMSQQKWDDVTTLKVTFNRYIYAPRIEGGGIRCVQTNETQDQVHGLAEFYIPKNLCNFEEFSLTFEGLARNSGDLEPPEPALYGSSGSGTNDQISNAKLYCA